MLIGPCMGERGEGIGQTPKPPKRDTGGILVSALCRKGLIY